MTKNKSIVVGLAKFFQNCISELAAAGGINDTKKERRIRRENDRIAKGLSEW